MDEEEYLKFSNCLKDRNYEKWKNSRNKAIEVINSGDRIKKDDLFEKCFPALYQNVYETDWREDKGLVLTVFKESLNFIKIAITDNYFAFQHYFFKVLSHTNTSQFKKESLKEIYELLRMNETIIQCYSNLLGNGYYIDHVRKFYKAISFPDAKYNSPLFSAISLCGNNIVVSIIAPKLVQSRNSNFLREYQNFFSQNLKVYLNYVYMQLPKLPTNQLDFFNNSIDFSALSISQIIDIISITINIENIEECYAKIKLIDKDFIPQNFKPLYYKLLDKVLKLCLVCHLSSSSNSNISVIIHEIINYFCDQEVLSNFLETVLDILNKNDIEFNKDELFSLITSINDPKTEIMILKNKFINCDESKSMPIVLCILQYCKNIEKYLDFNSIIPGVRRIDDVSTANFNKIDVKYNGKTYPLNISLNTPKYNLDKYLSYICGRKITGFSPSVSSITIDQNKFEELNFDKKYLIPTLAFSSNDVSDKLIDLMKYDKLKEEATKLFRYLIPPEINLKTSNIEVIQYYFEEGEFQNDTFYDISPLMERISELDKVLPILYSKCDSCTNASFIRQVTDIAMKAYRSNKELQKDSFDVMKKHFNLLSESTFHEIIEMVKLYPYLNNLIDRMNDNPPDTLISVVRQILRKESKIVGYVEIESLLKTIFEEWFIKKKSSSTLDHILLLQALNVHVCPDYWAEVLEESGVSACSYLERKLCFDLAAKSPEFKFELVQTLISEIDTSTYSTFDYGIVNQVATGVHNPNQLCYMASAFTLLAYNQEFLERLSSSEIEEESILSLKDTLLKISHSVCANVELDPFIKAWKWRGEPISLSVQQDVAEFFSALLGSLPKDVSDLFKLSTKHMKSVTDSFVLEVPVSTAERMYISLNTALDDLMKDIAVTNAPKNLLINLMRVQYTEEFDIPESLDFGGKRYVLCGGIGRHHTTNENGHYISFIRLGWKWINFNDGNSRELEHKMAMSILSGKIQPQLASDQFPGSPAAMLYYHEGDIPDFDFEKNDGPYDPRSFAFKSIENIGKRQNQNIGVLYFFKIACLSKNVLDVSDAFFIINSEILGTVLTEILINQARTICMSLFSHMIISSNTTITIFGMIIQILQKANNSQTKNFYETLSTMLEDVYELFGGFDSVPNEYIVEDIFESFSITNESKKRAFINNKDTLKKLVEKSGLLRLFIAAVSSHRIEESDLMLKLLECSNNINISYSIDVASANQLIMFFGPKFKNATKDLLRDNDIYTNFSSEELAKICKEFGLNVVEIVPIDYLVDNIKAPQSFIFNAWDNCDSLLFTSEGNKLIEALIEKMSKFSDLEKQNLKKSAGKDEKKFALYAICTMAPPEELFSSNLYNYMDLILKIGFNHILEIDYLNKLIESNVFDYFMNYLDDKKFMKLCSVIVINNEANCKHDNIKALSSRLIQIILDEFANGGSMDQFSLYLQNDTFKRLSVKPSEIVGRINMDKISERFNNKENLSVLSLLKWLWTIDQDPFHRIPTAFLAERAKEHPEIPARITIYYMCKEVFDEEAATVYQFSRSKVNLAIISECFSASKAPKVFAASFIRSVLPKTTLDKMELELFNRMMIKSEINPNELVSIAMTTQYDNTNIINFLKKYGADI